MLLMFMLCLWKSCMIFFNSLFKLTRCVYTFFWFETSCVMLC